MIQFSTISQHEIPQAIELAKSIFKENMAEQFVRLYSVDNRNHIFIAKNESGEICSLLCYYPSQVEINGVQLSVGSVGSVCTKMEYRGQKLASTLLDMAYHQMRIEHISVALISGAGGIYEASGAIKAGYIQRYHLSKRDLPELTSELTIRLATKNDWIQMYHIHQKEKVRFLRNKDEFVDLYTSQTYPDLYQTYPVYVVEKKGQTTGYLVTCNNPSNSNLDVREYVGERRDLLDAFGAIITREGKEGLSLSVPILDEFCDLLKHFPYQIIDQEASLKIVNPQLLWQQVKPLFPSQFEFVVEKETNYKVILNSKTIITFENPILFTRFIFGPISMDSIPENIQGLVPTPFPWSHGLNYQ